MSEYLIDAQSGTGDAGRYSRSSGLSASVYIAALWRVAKPTRHRSNRPQFLGPQEAGPAKRPSSVCVVADAV